jgi:hypothetical protein
VSVFVTMMNERNLAFMTVSIAIQSELGSKDAALQEFDVGDVVSPTISSRTLVEVILRPLILDPELFQAHTMPIRKTSRTLQVTIATSRVVAPLPAMTSKVCADNSQPSPSLTWALVGCTKQASVPLSLFSARFNFK